MFRTHRELDPLPLRPGSSPGLRPGMAVVLWPNAPLPIRQSPLRRVADPPIKSGPIRCDALRPSPSGKSCRLGVEPNRAPTRDAEIFPYVTFHDVE